MIQTVKSLKIVAYIRNEGEARSRKVIIDLTQKVGKRSPIVPMRTLLESSLPELHPGQGKTRVI